MLFNKITKMLMLTIVEVNYNNLFARTCVEWIGKKRGGDSRFY